jgi:5-methylcytosine-specific restriction endonuclease McrA
MSKRKSRLRHLHSAVYHRAAWQCQMPECLCPAGRKIDRGLRGTDDPWAPTVDHIKPLGTGGPDSQGNLRAAHRRCNQAGAALQMSPPARPKPPPLTETIGDLFPDLALLGRRDPDL